MRAGLLIAGIVLMVAGGIFFMIGYNGVQEYQNLLGQVGRSLYYGYEEEYQIYMLMETIGGVAALVGFILGIAGAVSSEKTKVGTETSEEIKKLAELHKDGLLTDREFRKRKRRLLK